jgi:hypothetical protein
MHKLQRRQWRRHAGSVLCRSLTCGSICVCRELIRDPLLAVFLVMAAGSGLVHTYAALPGALELRCLKAPMSLAFMRAAE